MKRAISFLAVLLFVLTAFCFPACAENEPIYAKYVPRTQRGTLFYVDIYSGTQLAAAVFELRYDPAAAEYRDVYCDNDNAYAAGSAENGAVKIGYSNNSSVKGKLFRVAFKALKKGTLSMELRISQAVDGDLNYIADIPSYKLDIELGSSDVVSSSDSKSSKKSSSKKSYSGSKFGISEADGDGEEPDGEENKRGISRDYSGSDKAAYFWLGGVVAVLVCLLIVGGVMLFRRIKAKRKIAPEPTESAEEDEDVALYEEFERAQAAENDPVIEPAESDDHPLPDVFKDIE